MLYIVFTMHNMKHYQQVIKSIKIVFTFNFFKVTDIFKRLHNFDFSVEYKLIIFPILLCTNDEVFYAKQEHLFNILINNF